MIWTHVTFLTPDLRYPKLENAFSFLNTVAQSGDPIGHGLVLGLVKGDLLLPAPLPKPLLPTGFVPPFTLTERA